MKYEPESPYELDLKQALDTAVNNIDLYVKALPLTTEQNDTLVDLLMDVTKAQSDRDRYMIETGGITYPEKLKYTLKCEIM